MCKIIVIDENKDSNLCKSFGLHNDSACDEVCLITSFRYSKLTRGLESQWRMIAYVVGVPGVNERNILVSFL